MFITKISISASRQFDGGPTPQRHQRVDLHQTAFSDVCPPIRQAQRSRQNVQRLDERGPSDHERSQHPREPDRSAPGDASLRRRPSGASEIRRYIASEVSHDLLHGGTVESALRHARHREQTGLEPERNDGRGGDPSSCGVQSTRPEVPPRNEAAHLTTRARFEARRLRSVSLRVLPSAALEKR